MNLARMMTEKVFIEDRNGSRHGPYKTKFGGDAITIFHEKLAVTEGDRIVQPLGDGDEHRYIAEHVSFSTGSRNIPAHYRIHIVNDPAFQAQDASVRFAGTDNPVAGMQTGRQEAERIASSMQSLAKLIHQSNFPVEQKTDAENLLRMLLENPVVDEVLNGKARDVLNAS